MIGRALRTFTAEECLALLRDSDVARIALSRRALPVVEPVHYRLAANVLVIAGDQCDSNERFGTDGHVVCFETDGLSGDGRGRWVVQVTGRLDVDHVDPVLSLAGAMIVGREWSRWD